MRGWTHALAALAVMAAGAAAQTAEAPPLSPSRAEPIVFDIMRRLPRTPVGPVRTALLRQLEQYRGIAHERSVAIGGDWMTAAQMRQRRERYAAALVEVERMLRAMDRREPSDPAAVAERRRQQREIVSKLRRAARIWGDPVLRNFLTAQVELLDGDFLAAERLFDQCVRSQPLVAGFYQGRALARSGLGRHLQAVEDWVALSYLRPGEPLVVEGLREALQAVPGTQIRHETFRTAGERLAAIDDPKLRPRRSSRGRGSLWLMPGTDWQGDDGSLPIPPYDTLIARRAVAVPVQAGGVLLVGSDALADAGALLLEVAPGRYVPAEPVRLRWRSSDSGAKSLPLAAIEVEGFAFAAVAPGDAGAPPPAAVGDAWTVHAVGEPAELGAAAIRRFTATVKSAGDGGLELSEALLPGEGTAPAFDAGGRLAAFLAGRTDVLADNGGPAVVFAPADVAAFVDAAARSGRPGRDGGERPVETVEGQSFILHVIAGQGGGQRR
ncbi:MAG: hypothetical protein GX591_06255 [Planctomycetes bacterium]|nr:hypothetical protein [Planctomycetota bacterium]